MWLIEALFISFKSLGENKLRTFLSVLGIVIGIASVIAMMSLGDGVTEQVLRSISSLGSNVITISRRYTVARRGRSSATAADRVFTLDLAARLKEAVPELIDVVPSVETNATLYLDTGDSLQTRVIGATPGYVDVYEYPLLVGRFIDEDDLAENRLVAVLSLETATELFGLTNPIGQSIRANIGNHSVKLTVVGVMSKKPQTAITFASNQIFVPVTALTSRGIASKSISSLVTKYESSDEEQHVMAALNHYLTSRLGSSNEFSVVSQESIRETMNEVASTITWFLAGIGGIGLLVGGISIMNIMLVSVTERTREIGIRKSLGAKKKHIFMQFLLEALVLSVAGGIIGIGAGKLLGDLMTKIIQIKFIFSVRATVIAILFSSAVGLFFGVYPAQKAARLNPVDALRYE